ncbi:MULTISPECIES: hypothetical protein [Rhodanobacter]|uniref:hypothetical protein n=1 Tax=Rhodanobacter TaxID=75309 RepID=UPI000403C8B8|nr:MULTISPECIES: hypothetical protein [Rhodanobacter]KZC18645.1 hypothetical protein RHOFW104R3_35430 [Rhodanobacter denitrificans]UJJ52371.1 hypothetical protein LRK52_06690 [Rhodanobacter denitrificans]UJM95124.1 hypothetical protein LRK32_06730 [Rhodanobacter denitrificans]UJM98655.1 hypothetical protein LRK44_06735 [Rhodanobacter denitrificans]UJN21930.1 hypothetical protein LRK54_01760 [Rhodanobacter denitrificans]
MPRVEVVPADTPFGERLAAGFGYPLRGAALPTCVVLALIHYVGLLPSWTGALAGALVWAATWRYAADCLLHTANGYADPPDVGFDGNSTSGWGLTAIHLLVVALCVVAIVFFPHLLWPVLILSALVLPAIDMSLAFDGNLALAINPLNWVRVIGGFGIAYLIPVAINLLLGLLIVLASVTTALLPRLLALPLFAFAYTYLIVLAFHLMGAMIHQRHERFGLEPEAEKLVAASHQDADDRLLDEARRLAADDPLAALRQLAARLQERTAPASVHQLYRELLRRQGLREDLLVHGQIWIAALIAQKESRRALGVLQECTGIDAAFVPDDPRTCGELAELAARLGMNRLAIQLCRGYLAHWPRDPHAPHYGLLAARQLAAHADQRAEAAALLERLAAAWPDHPLRSEIDAQRRQLASPA